jgi:hypothetical protein
VPFIISAFQHFRVQHFNNPDEKEPGNFALKTLKSKNATCSWSRAWSQRKQSHGPRFGQGLTTVEPILAF